MRNKVLFHLLTIILVIAISSAYSLAYTNLDINPVDSLVGYDEQFILHVHINSTDSIAGAQLDINFDPSVLQAISQVEGGFLSQDGVAAFDVGNKINNTIGKVTFNMMATTPNTGFNGTGHLVNVTFKAIKKNGFSYLTMFLNLLV